MTSPVLSRSGEPRSGKTRQGVFFDLRIVIREGVTSESHGRKKSAALCPYDQSSAEEHSPHRLAFLRHSTSGDSVTAKVAAARGADDDSITSRAG